MSSSNAPYLTAVNCSVGLPLGQIDLDRATALGVDRIELWWPWATPEPGAAAVDELVAELRRRELTLVALNFWGGDTAAGERGVLHQEPLTPTHLDAHARLAELTGADRFNLLVGRGGRDLTSAQRDHTAAVAESVTSRGQGTVLIEPSRSPGVGPADYPVQVIDDATALTDTIGGTGLLADFWHLVETVSASGSRSWVPQRPAPQRPAPQRPAPHRRGTCPPTYRSPTTRGAARRAPGNCRWRIGWLRCTRPGTSATWQASGCGEIDDHE